MVRPSLYELSMAGSTSRSSWSGPGLPGELRAFPGFTGGAIGTSTCEVIDVVAWKKDGSGFGRVSGGYLKIVVSMIFLLDRVKGIDGIVEELLTRDNEHECADLEMIRWDGDNSNLTRFDGRD